MRRNRTFVDPYGAQLHLAQTPDEWAHLARRFEFDPDIDSQGETRLVIDTHTNQAHLLVRVEPGRPDQTRRVVIHESVHAGAMLLDHVGQTYDGQSEALPYLVDWIAAWLLSRVGGGK